MEQVFRANAHITDKAAAMRTNNAVDLAVWDLIGKAFDTAVHRLLSGCKTEIPIIGYTYFEDGNDPGS